ncbi:MAG: tRNA pseudouridine(38-40) synthase TruA [Pseudomonadota bacterium]
MARYRITVEYDGGPFCGWQMQDNGPSVQGALVEALTKLSGERAQVFGAGRTDAGVHALGQVAHFDLSTTWQVDKIRDGLNFHLKPAPVAVLDAAEVDDEFHARFTATGRHYTYKIISRRPPLTVEKGRAWRVSKPLDAEAMHQAGQALVGTHDFTTFRSAHCQAKSPFKSIDVVTVSQEGDAILIRVSARSFLHNQVRSIAGSLKMVGEGLWTQEDLQSALQAADRSRCGPVAPPDGLYLTGVDYPLRAVGAGQTSAQP